MDITDIANKGLENIKKKYDNLNYFDHYGGSLLLFIIITILLLFFITSCIALTKIKRIKEDWVNQRCKPYIIPIAGFINKPENMSFNEFTKQNYDYCKQNILKYISGNALEPITFITNSSTILVNYMKDALNDSRAISNKVRTFFITVVKEIMGRLLNVIIPIQEIIIKFKDFMFKVQGTMVTGLLSTLGVMYTLKSALGLIVKFIITILITLAAMIFIFWLFPFTWGTAIASTATFIAVSIPLAVILTFMTKVMGIDTGLSIPVLKTPSLKCFDKNTELRMNDGTYKKITELEVGEQLSDNNLITSKIVIERKGSIMYSLNDVIVSDSHIVKHNDNWIRVDEHPNAFKVDNYNEPYLYCINTENKIIEINNTVFTDWDEIYDDELDKIKNVKIKNVKFNFNKTLNYSMDDLIVNNLDIHRYLDGGFQYHTEIKLKNGLIKNIKNVSIGDVLENGERVYGYVEIDGSNLIEQAIYNLAKNRFINGGSNLNICDKTMRFTSTLDLDKKFKNFKTGDKRDDKLYHLLTDCKTFNINGIKFYDYNSCIDLFLDKYRAKLLSMKYV
jgi:hypothetical protein